MTRTGRSKYPSAAGRGSIAAALAWGRGLLAGSASPGLDVQLLLGHVLGRDRSWLLAHPEAALAPEDVSAFRSLIHRRAAGEPVAYLRGLVHWGDLELAVGPGVLVPRPETEHLVDAVLDLAAGRPACRIADIGTGSGAIAIALARVLPDATVVAVDASASALTIARANLERYGLGGRVALLRGSLVDPLDAEPDILAANLPYLSGRQMATLPRDVRFEPADALYGGPSGCELYARLIDDLQFRGWRPDLALEIDPEQRQTIVDRMNAAWPQAEVRLLPDLAGRTRVALCVHPGVGQS